MTEAQFREFARGTPLTRPKYAGFARNVATAIENRTLENDPAAPGASNGILEV